MAGLIPSRQNAYIAKTTSFQFTTLKKLLTLLPPSHQNIIDESIIVLRIIQGFTVI